MTHIPPRIDPSAVEQPLSQPTADPNAYARNTAQAAVSSGVVGGPTVTRSQQVYGAPGGANTAQAAPTDSQAAALGLPAPTTTNPEELVLALQRLQVVVQNNQLQASTGEIQSTRAELKEASQQRLAALAEQLERLAESRNSSNIGRIFGLIGAALTIAVGVALAPAGVGIPLILAGVSTIVNSELGPEVQDLLETVATSIAPITGISQEDARAVTTGLAIAAIIAVSLAMPPPGSVQFFTTAIVPLLSPENLQASGQSERAAFITSITIQLSITAIVLVGGIGAAVFTGGSSVAASSAQTAQQVANIAQTAATVAQAAVTIGAASANIAATVQRYDAAQSEARALEFLADIFVLQQSFQQQTERLREALDEVEQTNDIVAGLLANFDRVATRVATI